MPEDDDPSLWCPECGSWVSGPSYNWESRGRGPSDLQETGPNAWDDVPGPGAVGYSHVFFDAQDNDGLGGMDGHYVYEYAGPLPPPANPQDEDLIFTPWTPPR